jgi:hypothetical protein
MGFVEALALPAALLSDFHCVISSVIIKLLQYTGCPITGNQHFTGVAGRSLQVKNLLILNVGVMEI